MIKEALKNRRSFRLIFSYSFLLYFILIFITLSACSFPVRTGYDRKIGDYKPTQVATITENQQTESNPSQTVAQEQPKPHKNSAAKAREAVNKKEIARAAPKKATDLESFVKPWLGTRYKLGGTSKSGIDCSGYVMVIYKQFYGIALDHHAEAIYKDSRGKKVSRGDLQEGDLVFFGDFWGISHIGIYLKGDRFTHASTSKGVMISPMSDKYWSPKYKGARRFK